MSSDSNINTTREKIEMWLLEKMAISIDWLKCQRSNQEAKGNSESAGGTLIGAPDHNKIISQTLTPNWVELWALKKSDDAWCHARMSSCLLVTNLCSLAEPIYLPKNKRGEGFMDYYGLLYCVSNTYKLSKCAERRQSEGDDRRFAISLTTLCE